MTVPASAGILRIVSGPTDDGSHRARGVVRPPPARVSEDGTSSVEVPRLEPPPPSLEAMVQSRPGGRDSERATWPLLVALVLLGALITAYVSR